MFNNWKSTLSWIVFVSVYIYAVTMGLNPLIVDSAGTTALISSIFMMFRSDFSKEAVNKLIDKISIGK